jgi:hypothetical protein
MGIGLYETRFSLSYEDAKQGLELAKSLPSYVPDGIYYGFIANAYAAPNKSGDGQNLVVDFSLHIPDSPYNKRVIRKYLSINKPGLQLKTILGEHRDPSDIIGKLFKLHLVRTMYRGEVKNDVKDVSAFNWTIPEHISEAADVLLMLMDPVNKGIYRRELSVDYYEKGVSHWILNDEEKPQVRSFHRTTKGWIVTHLLGHNCIKLIAKVDSIVVVPYVGDWIYEVSSNPILCLLGNRQYAIIKNTARGEVEKRCMDYNMGIPLLSTTPILLPWYNYDPQNGRFFGDVVGESMKEQILYLRRMLS